MNCPIIEQTADGTPCGRCWLALTNGTVCPRHAGVGPEVDRFMETGHCTIENVMRKRKGWPLLGPRAKAASPIQELRP